MPCCLVLFVLLMHDYSSSGSAVRKRVGSRERLIMMLFYCSLRAAVQ